MPTATKPSARRSAEPLPSTRVSSFGAGRTRLVRPGKKPDVFFDGPQSTVIEYRLRLHGVPFRWRALIAAFDPEASFTDLQLAGLYRHWHHHQEFEDVPGGTEMRDRVDYALPFGILGGAAWHLSVRSSLEGIFAYRNRTTATALRSVHPGAKGGGTGHYFGVGSVPMRARQERQMAPITIAVPRAAPTAPA